MASWKIAASEDWPPYKALWSKHLVLARDDWGNPVPWTHGVRRNARLWVPIFAVSIAWLLWRSGRAWWLVALAFTLGLLAGHFFWCGGFTW